MFVALSIISVIHTSWVKIEQNLIITLVKFK